VCATFNGQFGINSTTQIGKHEAVPFQVVVFSMLDNLLNSHYVIRKQIKATFAVRLAHLYQILYNL